MRTLFTASLQRRYSLNIVPHVQFTNAYKLHRITKCETFAEVVSMDWIDGEFAGIVNMEWIDGEFRLRKPGEGAPRYHTNCPVGWRTTRIDDIARFLPELHNPELNEAWRKFRRDDIEYIDWSPSYHLTPEDGSKYTSLFPTFNFNDSGCYSCLAYVGDVPPEPTTLQYSCQTLEDVLQEIDTIKKSCTRETKRMGVLPGPPRLSRDPCDGRSPPQKRAMSPTEKHCCGAYVIEPPPPPNVIPQPPPPPPPPPPIDPNQDPCNRDEKLPDVATMTEADWETYDLMGEHGYKCRPWVRLPSLNFLPICVDRVIAGEKGLLVVDGSLQSGEQVSGEVELPMHHDTGVYSAEQSITVVCNPLTKKFEFIPPFPKQSVKFKMAHMEVVPDPAVDGLYNMYNIYFVGYSMEMHDGNTNDDPTCPDLEVFVAVYNSNIKDWVTTYSRPFVRPLVVNQTNDLAMVKRRLYWISEWADRSKRIAVQNNSTTAAKHKWVAVISSFDLETRLFTAYSLPQEVYQNKTEMPLLLECNMKLYVVSRATAMQKKIPEGRFEIRLATYEEGSVKVEYTKIGIMPWNQYQYLFSNCYTCVEHTTEPHYECRAGLTLICFYVPQCGAGVLFDVVKCTWSNMDRHPGWEVGKKVGYEFVWHKNALASCIWEPDFRALWKKEYVGPKWDPLGNDPTGPDKWSEGVK